MVLELQQLCGLISLQEKTLLLLIICLDQNPIIVNEAEEVLDYVSNIPFLLTRLENVLNYISNLHSLPSLWSNYAGKPAIPSWDSTRQSQTQLRKNAQQINKK